MSDAQPLWNPQSLLAGGPEDDPPPAPSWQPAPATAKPLPGPLPPAGPAQSPGDAGAGPVGYSRPARPDPPPTQPGSGGSDTAGRHRRMAITAGAGLLVVAAVGGLALSAGAADEPAAGPPTGPAVAEPFPTGPRTTAPLPTIAETPTEATYPWPATPTAGETAEDALALDALNRQHARDRGAITFRGQHVAQLSSKIPGIRDPHQYAADGSHTFRATDILAEHESLRAGPNPGATVLLLKSTDYGIRQLYEGEALWVTVAVGDFPDRDAVLTWCGRRFPDLTGADLENRCAARTLEP